MVALASIALAGAGWTQTIPNPSFEANNYTTYPGYASVNGGSISGWTISDPTTTGINPSGASPFADNGAIPNGSRVAFIQSAGPVNKLSTTISSLTIGRYYRVAFRSNSRTGSGTMTSSLSLNGDPFVSFTASPPVGGSNPYYTNSGAFLASATTAPLVVQNVAATDSTVLIDDFTIAEITPVTLPASNVTASTATLNGTVNFPTNVDCYFQYGTTTNYDNTTAVTNVPATGNNSAVSATINGLSPGGVYHFRLVATNAAGVITGADMTFTNSASAIAPTATTQSATNITTSGATLKGLVNGGDQTGYYFQYGTTTNYGSVTVAGTLVSGNTNDVAVSAAVSALSVETVYHFRLVATNYVGTNFGADLTFLTLSVPATVATQPATGLSNTVGQLNGTVNPNSSLTTYYFQYGPTTNYGTTTPATSLPVVSTNVVVSETISGLSPGSVYHFRLVATNNAGIVFGLDRLFTPTTAPTATTQPATSVTISNATLKGLVNGGDQTGYYFEYGTTTNYGSVTTAGAVPVGTNDFSVSATVNGLSLEIVYHFRLVATNYLGTSFGSDLTFLTLSVPPTVATQPATSLSNTVGQLNGTINPNGTLTTYYFQYGATTNYGTTTTVTSLPVVNTNVAVSEAITGLSPGSVYHFRLVATNNAGIVFGPDKMFTPTALPTATTQPATGVSSSATLNGQVNGGDNTDYYFQYGTTTDYGNVTAKGSVPSGTNNFSVSAVVNGLSLGTVYHFRLVATNSLGTNAGADLTFTGTARPTVVTQPASVSNAVAQFSGTINPNGSATTYYFQYGLEANYGSFSATNTIIAGSSPVAVGGSVSGLTPGLFYHGRLVASNDAGIVRGLDVRFGAPSLVLSGLPAYTNECHSAFTVPGASATGIPVAITGGPFTSALVKSDGTVGRSSTGNSYQVFSSNYVAIAEGAYFTLFLRGDGTLAGLGDNNYGQATPPSGLSNVVAIAAGGFHGLAVKSDGTVAAWGWNANGQTNVPAGLSNVVAVAGGWTHSLALKNDGTVVAWGDNSSGKTNVPAGLSNVVAIATQEEHNLALKSDGTVVGWGYNGNGQTTPPSGLSNVVAIASGGFHSLALKSDGKVIAWGDNSFGKTNVPAGLSNVVAIAGGENFSFAMKSDGTLVGWGNYFNLAGGAGGTNTLSVAITGSLDTNSPGIYSFVYTATNVLGGITTKTRTITVRDTIPPVLTLLGTNFVLITNALDLPWIDPGATASDLCGGVLPINITGSVNMNLAGAYPLTYRVTDPGGNISEASRTVVIAVTRAVPGDLNGDGTVSQSELDAVYANYAMNSPWLYMTNLAGLGGTNVTFSLSNSVLGAYTIEYSTNLTDWESLGLATPQYRFVDTNAPVTPQRFYRLR